MAVHPILLSADVILLEGIRLAEVPEGIYFLNAAPLNLSGADGSPCRAVLINVTEREEENQWFIPANADKPADKRLKKEETLSRKQPKAGKKLPLPIGISDYRKASSEYYYVDKTLLIRDFIDEHPQVSLFTRPRRFGKTLNMDMLRVFFEKTDADTSGYFRNKKIWTCGKEYLTNILKGEVNENDVALVFLNLSRMLHMHYGTVPIIIIDEYDTPIQQGHIRGYYDKVIDFMRALFSGSLQEVTILSEKFWQMHQRKLMKSWSL